jgi:hypothetical protein
MTLSFPLFDTIIHEFINIEKNFCFFITKKDVMILNYFITPHLSYSKLTVKLSNEIPEGSPVFSSTSADDFNSKEPSLIFLSTVS